MNKTLFIAAKLAAAVSSFFLLATLNVVRAA